MCHAGICYLDAKVTSRKITDGVSNLTDAAENGEGMAAPRLTIDLLQRSEQISGLKLHEFEKKRSERNAARALLTQLMLAVLQQALNRGSR